MLNRLVYPRYSTNTLTDIEPDPVINQLLDLTSMLVTMTTYRKQKAAITNLHQSEVWGLTYFHTMFHGG